MLKNSSKIGEKIILNTILSRRKAADIIASCLFFFSISRKYLFFSFSLNISFEFFSCLGYNAEGENLLSISSEFWSQKQQRQC